MSGRAGFNRYEPCKHYIITGDGFMPPEGACNTYRALFAGMAELKSDLHTHIHLENAVLFPAAKKLAAI